MTYELEFQVAAKKEWHTIFRSYDSCTSRHTANKPDALNIDNN